MTACRTCRRPDRREIDRALARGEPVREIAERFVVGRSSVARHVAHGHVPSDIVVIVDRERRTGSLLDRVEELVDAAEAILTRNRDGADDKVALAAVRELRESLRLLGHVSGELAAGPVTQNLVIDLREQPEWAQFKEMLLRALAPFADARAAVSLALSEGGQARA